MANNNGGRECARFPVTSRPVAPGFRNFFITSERPDEIVYCDEVDHLALNGHTHTPSTSETFYQNIPSSRPNHLQNSSSILSSIIATSPRNSPNQTATVAVDAMNHASVSSNETEVQIASDGYATNVKQKSQEEAKIVSEEGNDKNKRQVLEQNTTDPSVAGPSASFVNHKKFHYQTRISVNVNDEVAQACNSHSATIDNKLEFGKQMVSDTTTDKRQHELTADDLKLSPYITRKQAEARLKFFGNLEETQREVDNFAALIYHSSKFQIHGTGKKTPTTVAEGLNSEVGTIGQEIGSEHWESASEPRNVDGGMNVETAGVLSSSEIKQETQKENQNRSAMKVGGYFQAMSPDHPSDFEWISDDDE